MKLTIAHWTINQKLALLVGVLGFLAVVAGNPYHGAETTLNAKEAPFEAATIANVVIIPSHAASTAS